MALTDFSKKTAVITGGASGIGLAVAQALYAAGAEAIFPPGTVIAEAAEELIHKLNKA